MSEIILRTMKRLSALLAFLFGINVCVAQSICDTLAFKDYPDHMYRGGRIMVYVDGPSVRSGDPAPDTSAYTTYIIKVYMTTCTGIIYLYKYTSNKQLTEEGFCIEKTYTDTIRRFLRKPKVVSGTTLVRDGTWKTYNGAGKIVSEECYRNDIVCDTCECRRLRTD
jgi:hypothetical protein